ncbi:MAG: effector-associated domain EAD1-containing protein, partial [Cyanobacteria bacterium P01_D01_bin.50]
INHPNNLEQAVFELVNWAKSHGKLQELINAVCHCEYGNPGNSQLKPFCQQYSRSQSTENKKWHLLNPCQFDLSQLVTESLNYLYHSNGNKLLGIAVPCNESDFPNYFCQRLIYKLRDTKIQYLKAPITINPRLSNINGLIYLIEKNIKSLQEFDIILRVQIDSCPENYKKLEQFWQEISNEKFQKNIKKRLIITMFCNERNIFPKTVEVIEGPKFQSGDVYDWVIEVARNLEWSNDVTQQWTKKFIDDCCYPNADSKKQLLDIQNVYFHIVRAIDILRTNTSETYFIENMLQMD